MKKKVRIWGFFLAQHISAIAQLRCISPFSHFPNDEFEFIYAPSFKAVLKLFNKPRIIVFHRDICPFRVIDKIIRFAHSHDIVIILDMDDLLTDVPQSHPAYLHYQKIKPSLIKLLGMVDIVTVTNNRLKEYYQKYNPNVRILPNFLDKNIWSSNVLTDKTDDKIVIGYAGLPAHACDFKTVIPAVRYILSKYNRRVSFKFIGCIPDELKNVSGIEYISESVSYREYADILMNSNFDFVIAPLEDNVFNQCKSNIKFLEYSICGYAGIYSAVGPYIDSIVPDKTGILVKNTTDEWKEAIERLVNNAELRHALGRNAFNYVKTHYWQETRLKDWYQIYSRISASLPEENRSFSSKISYACFLIYIQALNIYYKIQNIALRAFSKVRVKI